MTELQARQRIEELCAATLRALADDPALRMRGHRLHRGRVPLALPVPHLHPDPDDPAHALRGIADGIALRLTHSDPVLRRALRPEDRGERLVYELLEQFRVESLAVLPGMAGNLRRRQQQWWLSLSSNGTTETEAGLLLFSIAQICRARISGEAVLEEHEGRIESTRFALAPLIGKDLAELRRSRHHQETFAKHALSIAKVVGAALREGSGRRSERQETDARLALLLDFDADIDETTVASGAGGRTSGAATGYRVYSREYDREERAGAIVRRELLAQYRESLDRRIADSAVHPGRLARELHALLAESHYARWESQQEEGYLDPGLLSTLISSPTERNVFLDRRAERVPDARVTFLIDCSGSMKAHAERIAVLVDLFAHALELADIDCEILGFTTAAWNGGRARRDWIRSGRPANPGRCNEIRHLIFKDTDTRWRSARAGISALCKQDLFRESVDGEAVEWAYRRAGNSYGTRKILFVFSDGSPVDSATTLANDGDPLDAHLLEVVSGIERAGDVGLFGLGVGADVSRYYSANRVLDVGSATTAALVGSVLGLLSPRRTRS